MRARLPLALAAAALAATAGGCFTTWTVTQLAGGARAWDEQVREEAVPQAGLEERLAVELPLGLAYPPPPPAPGATATAPATTSPSAPASAAEPLPLALTCRTTQRGTDLVYRSGFRYGSRWKKTTAAMALLEGAAAAAFLLASTDPSAASLVYGGYLAVDALGTAAIFFIPRKEIYRRDLRPVVTPVRDDCPDGLILDIAGEAYPVDAAGRLGELGELALDDWMQAPTGPLRLELAGQATELVVGAAERCTWNRHRGRPPAPGCAYPSGVPAQTATAALLVEPGTLTGLPEPTASTGP